VGTLLHQDREQLQADRVEFEQAPFAGNFQGVEVVIKIGHLQGATAATLGTPQHGFDTRGQFRQGKRFEQIIVGAGLEALQPVIQLVASGEHDHRCVAAGVFTQAFAQGVAIDARQHDVEHDQVVVLGGGQVQARQTVLRTVHGVAF